MTTPLQAARERVIAIRARHLGARSVAAWRSSEPADRKCVIADIESASYDVEGKRRDRYLAAADVLESAGTSDGLGLPDALLGDLEWLLTELDERLARER
ncbi:MAG: hypothetical protein R3B40_29735 [Polyangiales bacterium]|nr:hypothetical protein [Sandaracinaceae bacterium]